MNVGLKVLVVEENEQCSDAIVRVLRSYGHTVTAVRCIIAVEDGILQGIDWSHYWLTLTAADFQVALVDGKVPDKPLQGWDLMPLFVDAGITCVGIYDYSGSNLTGRDASGEHLAGNGAVPRLIEQQLIHGKLTKAGVESNSGASSSVLDAQTEFELGDKQWIWI